jgi:hypothetical protein
VRVVDEIPVDAWSFQCRLSMARLDKPGPVVFRLCAAESHVVQLAERLHDARCVFALWGGAAHNICPDRRSQEAGGVPAFTVGRQQRDNLLGGLDRRATILQSV